MPLINPLGMRPHVHFNSESFEVYEVVTGLYNNNSIILQSEVHQRVIGLYNALRWLADGSMLSTLSSDIETYPGKLGLFHGFEIAFQLLIYLLIAASIYCSKKSRKKDTKYAPSGTLSSSKSSGSINSKTPRKRKGQTSSYGALPAQLREIAEAERMAKQNKAYDNFELDLDDDVK
ncbi:hypothetical protein RB195_012399 [Necator americanus]|uniref:Uncharacterized protein n=1 Tax=Necator americanus TaxID=51031 RepID=A0ABR1D7S8_NECAM